MSTAIQTRPIALDFGREEPRKKRRRLRFSTAKIPVYVAFTIVVAIVLIAIFAPVVAPQSPLTQKLSDRLLPPMWEAKGSGAHILGTDQLGRDLLSRLIWGARPTLFLGLISSTMALTIGVSMGMLAGLGPVKLGSFIMRASDAQLAFPALVGFIAVIAVLGPSFLLLILLLGLNGWAGTCKLTRSQVLAVKHREYVEAARVIGAKGLRVAVRHILPNIASPLLVLYTFTVANLMLLEATLSFLGLGIQPPTPAWGSMLSEGQALIDSAWWLGMFPGLAIMLTVLSLNILGDALRDSLDPRLRRQT